MEGGQEVFDRQHLDIVKPKPSVSTVDAYQAESDLLALLRPHYARANEEGRTLVTSALESAGKLEVSDGELRVTLAPLSSPHRSQAIVALCGALNGMDACYPVCLREDAQSRILRFLWRSRAEWSGREIARRVGLSAPACHGTIKKLDAQGLVQLRRASNLHLYKINSKNYVVRNVFARVFKAEAAMPKQVAGIVRRFRLLASNDPKVYHVFGRE